MKATVLCWLNNAWRRLVGRPIVHRDNWEASNQESGPQRR